MDSKQKETIDHDTASETEKLNQHIRKAIEGNSQSLSLVLDSVKTQVFNLSLRMTVDHQLAEDASQEILIRIMTNLGSFRFESQFKTWVYRLASNYLISNQRIKKSELGLTFEEFQSDLESDLQAPSRELQTGPDYQIMLNELRISCTMAMLLCLKPKARLAYVLGEILELEHNEASEILETSSSSYRKQLQRARSEVLAFTHKSCGLVNENAACYCDKKLTGTCKRGCVTPNQYRFAKHTQIDFHEVEQQLQNTQTALKSIFSQRSIQAFETPSTLNLLLTSVVHQAKQKYTYNEDMKQM